MCGAGAVEGRCWGREQGMRLSDGERTHSFHTCRHTIICSALFACAIFVYRTYRRVNTFPFPFPTCARLKGAHQAAPDPFLSPPPPASTFASALTCPAPPHCRTSVCACRKSSAAPESDRSQPSSRTAMQGGRPRQTSTQGDRRAHGHGSHVPTAAAVMGVRVANDWCVTQPQVSIGSFLQATTNQQPTAPASPPPPCPSPSSPPPSCVT